MFARRCDAITEAKTCSEFVGGPFIIKRLPTHGSYQSAYILNPTLQRGYVAVSLLISEQENHGTIPEHTGDQRGQMMIRRLHKFKSTFLPLRVQPRTYSHEGICMGTLPLMTRWTELQSNFHIMDALNNGRSFLYYRLIGIPDFLQCHLCLP